MIYEHADLFIKDAGDIFSCGTVSPCNACCTQTITTSRVEFLKALQTGINSGFIDMDKLKSILKIAEIRKDWTERDRFKANVPCVFLDADSGKCGIYEGRPFVCRTYHAKKSFPAKQCNKNRGHIKDEFLYRDDRLTALGVILFQVDGVPYKSLEQHLIDEQKR